MAEPAPEPAGKRLAVPAEYHCREQDRASGAAAESMPIAGSAVMWDAGTYDNQTMDRADREVSAADAIDRGHLCMVLHGKRLQGNYSLTQIGQGNPAAWLLVRRGGGLAGRTGRNAHQSCSRTPASCSTFSS